MIKIKKLGNFLMPGSRVWKQSGKSSIEIKTFSTLVVRRHIFKEPTIEATGKIKHSWLRHLQLEEIVKHDG